MESFALFMWCLKIAHRSVVGCRFTVSVHSNLKCKTTNAMLISVQQVMKFNLFCANNLWVYIEKEAKLNMMILLLHTFFAYMK